MYAYNHGTNGHVPQGYAPNAAHGSAPGYAINPAYVPPPGFVTATLPAPVPTPSHTPTPTLVQVPAGCYPIELVQFRRDECKRGHPYPLHWALFVRTAPAPPSSASVRTSRPARPTSTLHVPLGNFYELVGTPDTHTAQFLPGVSTEPTSLPDWRGAHVIGWVHPAQLGVFERAVRQVQVWRHRPEWRCQEWAYDVVCALAGTRYPGIYVEGWTWVGLQRHMGRLLEAWESGDI